MQPLFPGDQTDLPLQRQKTGQRVDFVWEFLPERLTFNRQLDIVRRFREYPERAVRYILRRVG
jgi:hypothetical protein